MTARALHPACPPPQAFFLPDGDGGRRFALWHLPATAAPKALLLYVHPFAEEMNKTRRMAALQARRLAASGYAVMQVDLFGCGDSSGRFVDATWQHWIDDVTRSARWLLGQAAAPLWLWGLRAGALLCTAALPSIGAPCKLLLWQPIGSGKLALQQFLRLRTAADALAGAEKGAAAQLRSALARGEAVDIAGYALSAPLAAGLEAATLLPPPQPCRVEWLEVSNQPDGGLSPAAATQVERWRAAGHAVNPHVVAGPSFWQTTEIEEAPALLDATEAALAAGAPT